MLGRQWRPDLWRGWDLGQSLSLRKPGLRERLVFRCMYARRHSVLDRQRRPDLHPKRRLELRCPVWHQHVLQERGMRGQLCLWADSLLGQRRPKLRFRRYLGNAQGVHQPSLCRWRVRWNMHTRSYPVF